MIGSFITGALWGVACYLVGYGYFFFSISKETRMKIYRSKFYVLILDFSIIIFFGASMKAGAGSVSAGVGTAILGVLCFLTSFSMYQWQKWRDEVNNVNSTHEIRHT